MSVMQAMGLDNEQVLDLLVERWPQWCRKVPDLELLAEPARIDAWRRAAPAAQVDRVLRGLAQLAATDGGDDLDAARVLAWLLMPVAVRLSAELVEFDPDIDEHIAACLWIEVRTARWQQPCAADVECGVAVAPAGVHRAGRSGPDRHPSGPDVGADPDR